VQFEIDRRGLARARLEDDHIETIARREHNVGSARIDQCPGGGDSLRALIGLRMGTGWNGEVRKRLSSCDTCTHLKECSARSRAPRSRRGLDCAHRH